MKYPLTNTPQYKVQHYLGKTVGEMLLDPTAIRFLSSGLSSSQLVLTAPTGIIPSSPSVVFNDNNGTLITNIRAFNPGGGFTYIIGDATTAPNVTGRNNYIQGTGALLNGTTVRDTVAIGANAGWGITGGEKSVIIGNDTLDTGFVGTIGSVNVVVGANNFDNGLVSSFGSANTVIGSFNQASGPVVNDNIVIGVSNNIGSGTSNTTVIASDGGYFTSLSNVFIAGTNQNMIIKGGTTPVDNGSALQVHGTMTTGGAAPLTLAAGAWDFGKVKVATSTLSTTHYLEVSVDGVLYKVCIN